MIRPPNVTLAVKNTTGTAFRSEVRAGGLAACGSNCRSAALDRTPEIFDFGSFHTRKLPRNAILVEHLQAELDVREDNVRRAPGDEI
jgi:hypothetical protein